jgi:hydrogenase nickel incorporation protein HypA/HybF
MHELSLALDVIELVSKEAEKNGVRNICEIEIEVGNISGVDAEAFRTALEIALGNWEPGPTKILIRQVPAAGICSACGNNYEMKDLYSLCPDCGESPSEIIRGKELRVISITAE